MNGPIDITINSLLEWHLKKALCERSHRYHDQFFAWMTLEKSTLSFKIVIFYSNTFNFIHKLQLNSIKHLIPQFLYEFLFYLSKKFLYIISFRISQGCQIKVFFYKGISQKIQCSTNIFLTWKFVTKLSIVITNSIVTIL